MILGSTSQILPVVIYDTAGVGLEGATAASMAGTYIKNNAVGVPLAFSPGAIGDAYSSGKWAEEGSGLYYYHFPDLCFNELGYVQFTFRNLSAVASMPSALVEAEWIRIGDSRTYTNDTTAATEDVTVT